MDVSPDNLVCVRIVFTLLGAQHFRSLPLRLGCEWQPLACANTFSRQWGSKEGNRCPILRLSAVTEAVLLSCAAAPQVAEQMMPGFLPFPGSTS